MRRFPLSALLACAPLAAYAGDEVGHFYVDPEVGGIDASRDRGTKEHDWLYGVGFGYNISENWTAEVNLNSVRLKDELDPGHLRLYDGTVDILRVFNRPGVFAPYVAVGAGVQRNAPSLAPWSTDFVAEAGLGAFVKLWENGNASRSFSLKPDIKARWDDTGMTGHLVDYVATMGFVFSFGPGVSPPPVAAPPPPPPPAARVEPAPAPVVTTPPDSDHDGVPDNVDRCPETPLGVAVDQYGCPQKGSITLEGVTFETNSAVLTGDSRPVLNDVAAGVVKHPRLKIELEGFTDATGSAKYNLVLSDKRANAVRDYLVTQGVPSTQLSAKGYGKAQPVADNTTPAGRAKNRRVVMKVLENPGDVEVKGAGETK
jgi:OOP family OmpA-OmpF porin